MKRLEAAPTSEAIADSIANDTANRNDELADLVRLIDSIEGPYSLLLDAPWGDGKTFFVRSLEEVLKTLNPHIASTMENDQKLTRVTKGLDDIETPYLPFYFNAWEHDFADDPISALFASMAVTFDATGLTVEHPAHKAIAAIIEAALAAAQIPSPFAKIASSVAGQASDVIEAVVGESLISAYKGRAKLRGLIDKLAEESIIEVANKLVIIIDELDRCRPDFAVRLLEQTKSLFQSENIIVVISADSRQLAHATAGLYGPGYDSQRFIERFYDQRLLLSPSDPYRVVEGHGSMPTGYKYDVMVNSLRSSHALTIRDYQRLRPQIEAGRDYCNQPYDGSIASTVAKCVLVPLLIFLERDDTEKFREVVTGHDHDALYELGSKHEGFIESLASCTAAPDWPKTTNAEGQMAPVDAQTFIRDVSIWLFANEGSDECRAVSNRLTVPYGLDKSVFRTLRFPSSPSQS